MNTSLLSITKGSLRRTSQTSNILVKSSLIMPQSATKQLAVFIYFLGTLVFILYWEYGATLQFWIIKSTNLSCWVLKGETDPSCTLWRLSHKGRFSSVSSSGSLLGEGRQYPRMWSTGVASQSLQSPEHIKVNPVSENRCAHVLKGWQDSSHSAFECSHRWGQEPIPWFLVPKKWSHRKVLI